MWQHPTGNTPDAVAILALGGSRVDWDQARLVKGVQTLKAEVWTVNRGLRLWQHDLAFVMDDLRRESAEDPDYGQSILSHDRPIITSKRYPEHGDHIHELPLAAMAEWARRSHVRPYWCNSIPFMIAYAAFIGTKTIYIHGADYTDDMGRVAEKGRSNVEYWIGVCEAIGINVGVSPNGRLLGHQDFPAGYIYGYDLQWEARELVMQGLRQATEQPIPTESDDPPQAEPTPPAQTPATPADPTPPSALWRDPEGNPTTIEDAPRNELGLVLAYCGECGARWPRHQSDCSEAGPPGAQTAG